jgi:sirohydrochlorin cobaltochelatase
MNKINGKVGIVLVGHGAVPKNFPMEKVIRFKQLERSPEGMASQEFGKIDMEMRRWPRTPDNDPYEAGVKAIAQALRGTLGTAFVREAYNEFCAPTLEEAVEEVISHGADRVVVVPTMATRGGIHSEVEIPGILQTLRSKFPDVSILYAWPFDLQNFAGMLAVEINRALSGSLSALGDQVKELKTY